MNTTPTADSTVNAAGPASAEITVEGTITSPLVLVYPLPYRTPRLSFRIEGAAGPHNVRADGIPAELYMEILRTGTRITVHADRATSHHPDQLVPELEVHSIEVAL